MTTDPPNIPGIPPNQPETSGFEAMEGGTTLSNVLHRLLKKPLSLIHHFEHGEQRNSLTGKLVLIAAICLLVFGLVVGSFSAGTQLWAAPLKIVGGLLFSALICLPSLYIFTCLGGLNAKFRTVAGLLCCMIALAALLLVGFAPVVWLFSASSNSIGFMGFLLTALWLLCVGFGLTLVRRAGKALGMKGSGHLVIWCAVFLLVTLQMPTTLRPIIGKSDRILNLGEKRFFLQYWGEQLTTPHRPIRTAEEDLD
ncbi:MAG: hypothetical protein O3A92_14805 [Verrucomicrobia bacterium]|nr:hypothetical protein [Verrucomicrobiota bacterium]